MGALEGRRIVVTGAARGIGAAVATAFVGEGARVALMDVRDELGLALAARLNGPGEAFYLRCDVARQDDVAGAFDAVAARFGGLDVLAAVAGLDRPSAPQDLVEADWDLVMGVSAKGTYLTNQAAFRLMADGGGSIINFGSLAGVRGMPERPAYSAAKGAVAAWTRAVAQAWGPLGVRVNTIAPIMRTEVADAYLNTLPEAAREEIEARMRRTVPMGGRMGDPLADLAPLMVFLAGPGSAYITGQLFAVDGGMTMVGA